MSNEITEYNEPTETALSQFAHDTEVFELTQRQAKLYGSSTMVPKEYQSNVANCAIAISVARRLSADPFAIMQSMDIIHGRPSWRASFLIAMVNACGRFTALKFRETGKVNTESWGMIAYCNEKETGEVVEGPEVTCGMAKAEGWSTKNGSKWKTMPALMLRYRAAAFFARLYAPDLTLGIQTQEEVYDAQPPRDVTPAPAGNPFARKPSEGEPLTLEATAEDDPSLPNTNEENKA